MRKRKRKTLRSALIICSSLVVLALSGCQTIFGRTSKQWPLPPKPETSRIEYKDVNGGYFISEEDSVKIANNIDELKKYIEKLEALIDSMKDYYKE